MATTVFDVKITDVWLFVSINNTVLQFSTPTGALFSNSSRAGLYYVEVQEVVGSAVNTSVFLWNKSSGLIDCFSATDEYTCVGCTACNSGYTLTSSGTCAFGVASQNTTANATTNATTNATANATTANPNNTVNQSHTIPFQSDPLT